MSPSYVCVECAHTWSAPEWPECCENCSAAAFCLRTFPDLDDAEEFSQGILDAKAQRHASLRAARTRILARGDGRDLASSEDEAEFDRLTREMAR